MKEVHNFIYMLDSTYALYKDVVYCLIVFLLIFSIG